MLEISRRKVINEYDACFKTPESRLLTSREDKIFFGSRFHIALTNLERIFHVDHTTDMFGFTGGSTGSGGRKVRASVW